MNIVATKSPPSPFITLTGADERTDLDELAKLDAEVGLLCSFNSSAPPRPRYPRWSWIWETSKALPRAALHVCGQYARQLLAGSEFDVSGFQRIQVNGPILALEVERLCLLYPDHTIITQHRSYNEHLLFVKAPNHAILIDSSGGKGVSPDMWAAPHTDKPVGFAGGLGPDNLTSELERILDATKPGWWVDMEGKLREDDWFSLQKARECTDIFHRTVAEMFGACHSSDDE